MLHFEAASSSDAPANTVQCVAPDKQLDVFKTLDFVKQTKSNIVDLWVLETFGGFLLNLDTSRLDSTLLSFFPRFQNKT